MYIPTFIFCSSCFPSVLWWGKWYLSNFNLKEFLCVSAFLICLFINECLSVGCLCKVTHASVKTSQNWSWHKKNLIWNSTLETWLTTKHLKKSLFEISNKHVLKVDCLTQGALPCQAGFLPHFGKEVPSCEPLDLSVCIRSSRNVMMELRWTSKLLKLSYCLKQRRTRL